MNVQADVTVLIADLSDVYSSTPTRTFVRTNDGLIDLLLTMGRKYYEHLWKNYGRDIRSWLGTGGCLAYSIAKRYRGANGGRRSNH